MAFAPGGDAEKLAEAVVRHGAALDCKRLLDEPAMQVKTSR
jgi:hypothetical protein